MKLAVIPARGGSKRIPRKNIRPFAGKPMIVYAIEAAQASGLFGQVVVSTDDQEIACIARAAGAQVPFMRPAALADDFTPTVPVVTHAIRNCLDLGWAVEEVCCIYPAVPLIRAQDIVEAHAVLSRAPDARSAFPVAAFPSTIQRALRRSPDGQTQPFHPEYEIMRSQDLEPAYFDAGQFYWASVATWLEGVSLHAQAVTIELPQWRVVDIDTPDDWERAQALYQVLQTQGAQDESCYPR